MHDTYTNSRFPRRVSTYLLTYDTLRSKKSILAELNDWDTCWPTHLKHEAPASNRNPSALGQGVKI